MESSNKKEFLINAFVVNTTVLVIIRYRTE